MVSKTKTHAAGDFLLHEESPIVCREGGTLQNPAGGIANIENIAGHPVKLIGSQWTLLLALDEANVGGWVISGPPISDLAASGITQEKYPILVRGPAAINRNLIPAADSRGTNFTVATLEANVHEDIVLRDEPATQEEQTT